jgi:hypothetical protein
MVKKVTKKNVKKSVAVSAPKKRGFNLTLILAVALLMLAVLLFDLVEGFLSGKKNVMMDWSKIPAEQQIDLELKNAQEAIKLDVAAFNDDTLGK